MANTAAAASGTAFAFAAAFSSLESDSGMSDNEVNNFFILGFRVLNVNEA